MTRDIADHAANAAWALAHAMEAAVELGAPDDIIFTEVIKLACRVLAAANGGERNVPTALRLLADGIESHQKGDFGIN